MTDLKSASQEAAQRYNGNSADEASHGARTGDSDRGHTGRHRAAEEPEQQGAEDPAVSTTDLFAMRPQESLASYLPGGVGAAAFHAVIDAARTSVSRQPIERLDERSNRTDGSWSADEPGGHVV
jgi:hypothetical protein